MHKLRILSLIGTIGIFLVNFGSAAQTWSATSLAYAQYIAVACSADGTTLVTSQHQGPLAETNTIYISTNGGTSWSPVKPGPIPGWLSPTEPFWHAVATSADGTMIMAAAFNGPICTSTNGGLTWAATGSEKWDNFQAAAASADGKSLIAVSDNFFWPPSTLTNSGIYLSTDGGLSWTQANAPRLTWFSAAASADGRTFLAGAQVAQGSSVYISTNSGAAWHGTPLPPSSHGVGIACSADGTRMVAGPAGELFTSSDSGATWGRAGLTNATGWAVTCSADGTKMAAAGRGSRSISPIYVSADGGSTWTKTEAPQTNWWAIAGSADGNALIASTMPDPLLYGEVYVSQATPCPRLDLVRSGNDFMLSWIVPSQRFTLQQSPDCLSPNWMNVTTQPVLDFSTLRYQVNVTVSPGGMFYRLVPQ